MNRYLDNLLADEKDGKDFEQQLKTYKTYVNRSRWRVRILLFFIMLTYILIDVLVGLLLYKNYNIKTFLSIFIPFQLTFAVFYLFFIKIYINNRKKTNIFLGEIINTDHVYAIYRQQWKKLKTKNQISLNMSKIILNNICGFTRFFSEEEYSLVNGGTFDENYKGINSIVYYDDNWKVTYYTVQKKGRFDYPLYPIMKGNVTLANSSHRTIFTDKQSNVGKGLSGKFKVKKHKYATFLNFKFADTKDWVTIKNSFKSEDLKYLSSRGIYVKIGNKDLSFCFLETTKDIFTPGIFIFTKDRNFLRSNLHDKEKLKNIYDYITMKIDYDLNNFLSKYLLINWFVQKYRKKINDGNSYLIERLKNDI